MKNSSCERNMTSEECERTRKWRKGVGYAEHKWRKLLNSKCRGQPEEEVYCKHFCYRKGKLEEGHEPAKQTEKLRLTGPKNYAEQRVRKIKKLFRGGGVREKRKSGPKTETISWDT